MRSISIKNITKNFQNSTSICEKKMQNLRFKHSDYTDVLLEYESTIFTMP
jgi:hypothetical protein